jgi:hypothetical protein
MLCTEEWALVMRRRVYWIKCDFLGSVLLVLWHGLYFWRWVFLSCDQLRGLKVGCNALSCDLVIFQIFYHCQERAAKSRSISFKIAPVWTSFVPMDHNKTTFISGADQRLFEKIKVFFKNQKHEPNVVEVTHLCIMHRVHTNTFGSTKQMQTLE